MTTSPLGERVKKCMNHLRDSLVGSFVRQSLGLLDKKPFVDMQNSFPL